MHTLVTHHTLTANGIRVRAVSTLLESVAVKPDGEDEAAPRYLNGVAFVHTRLLNAPLPVCPKRDRL